jgi:hypothetical protein
MKPNKRRLASEIGQAEIQRVTAEGWPYSEWAPAERRTFSDSLHTQRDGKLFNRSFHMSFGSLGQSGHSLLQEILRRVKLLIGRSLLLLAFAVTLQIDPEFLGGCFDLLHGPDAMALVVVVSSRQSGIRLAQQAGCRR